MSYMERLLRAHEIGTVRKGSVTVTEIQHDAWCGALHGGICVCNATVVIDGRELLEDGTLGRKVPKRGR
jgi:hypothetical protein